MYNFHMSIDYYNKEADAFFESTIDVDMKNLYTKFEKYISPHAHILDAGCGSGRDVKYFLDEGYVVSAFDASEELVQKASEYTGIDVNQMLFQDLDESNEYDAIWSCASLLHVPRNEIHDVFVKFIRALKNNGVWYMSFKSGENERDKDGRFFNDYTTDKLKLLLESYSDDLNIKELWITSDNRPDRNEQWTNAILIKK